MVAAQRPVGAPPGVVPRFVRGVGNMSGAMHPFCALAVGGDGRLYVSGDAEGSVLALKPA